MEKALAEDDFKKWNIDFDEMTDEEGMGPRNPVGGW